MRSDFLIFSLIAGLLGVSNAITTSALSTSTRDALARILNTDIENQIVAKVYGVATKNKKADGTIVRMLCAPRSRITFLIIRHSVTT